MLSNPDWNQNRRNLKGIDYCRMLQKKKQSCKNIEQKNNQDERKSATLSHNLLAIKEIDRRENF